MSKIVLTETSIEDKIFHIRGKRVMIDRDLAEFYGVETKYLNRQVRRNRERFPAEFMLQLTQSEKQELVTNWHRFRSLKHSSSLPLAFTENGVAMLASVLNSKRAVRVSIYIIKAFIRLRELITENKEILFKLGEIENRVDKHEDEIRYLIQTIRKLMNPGGSDQAHLN